ncbi:hypothetical protein BDV59DRAFT_54825 [Aspergillus ambiguus]|uniref:uncharacterized protein n=1 Tax=Aspergillus ambiguus TaxID=176160 RepID=UPI003CCE1C8F
MGLGPSSRLLLFIIDQEWSSAASAGGIVPWSECPNEKEVWGPSHSLTRAAAKAASWGQRSPSFPAAESADRENLFWGWNLFFYFFFFLEPACLTGLSRLVERPQYGALEVKIPRPHEGTETETNQNDTNDGTRDVVSGQRW